MVNRLASATSPYLLQHAENPVDWREWGHEAFAEAKRRDTPILLSVGYAACHWCHVMAHESFEDDEIAALANANFVPVKVDREERPDVDAAYMAATTALTGQGGWPMTCLLTPAGEPFWAGTYLPKASLIQLLHTATDTWQHQQEQVIASSAKIVAAINSAADQARTVDSPGLTGADLSTAVRALHREFDPQWGGFGGAPKFPPSMVLAFLLRHHGRTGDEQALAMVRTTCESMARSGTYDQLAGGFARYATDRAWVVPHFEKMLYDNALALGVYADLARADETSRTWAERVVRQTVDWLLNELWTEQQAFASSLDADTDGVEGKTYVWTPGQLIAALGETDGRRAGELLGVTDAGTFEAGASTLQLRRDPDDRRWWAATREKLLVHRALRAQPDRDDKVVTAWNGLLINSLAHAGWVFDEPDWIDVAGRCATFLLSQHLVAGRLRRSSLGGVTGAPLGVAEDYGNLIEGLLTLHRVTGDSQWLDAAADLASSARTLFLAPDGSITANGKDAEALVLNPPTGGDNAEPGGASALACALLRYGSQAGSAADLQAGRAAVATISGLARQAPRFAGWALAGAEDAVAGPIVIRLSGTPETAQGGVAWARATRHTPVGSLLIQPASPEGPASAVVCRGTVCELPVTEPGALPRGR